jgi:subtilisin family serine protease
VIDSGVDLGHPDLAPNLLPGITFQDCGDAGCGNGANGTTEDELGEPDHGTHVAGIIGAVANNGIGVAGVAPGVRILPINVFRDYEDTIPPGFGAKLEDVARAVRWAVDHGAHVVNLSLGTLDPFEPLLGPDDTNPLTVAIADAVRRGVVVVGAAGNETLPYCESPSFADGVLCVAAVDRFGAPTEYSNLPVKADSNALRAPGGAGNTSPFCDDGVLSTVTPRYTEETCSRQPGYGTMAGSSMSAPHVAAVAALVRSLGCDGPTTVEVVTATARNPITGARGAYDPVYGHGIVDAAAAVEAAGARCRR